jgi:amine acid ABC transporter, permease protein, 3-TM region, His/Glu/Gln/Arg/opine family
MIRDFGYNEFMYILFATKWTILLSLIAFAGGSFGGMVIALMRTSGVRALELISTLFIQIFQGTPLLMQLFLAYFGGQILGLDVDPWVAASTALALNTSAFLGEIWRGCIQAVPHGQVEAAMALGLKYAHRMRYVVLPQALKIALPPTVGYLVQVIKGTSLASIIGFIELTRAGQIINNATFEPLKVFGVVAAIYFFLCWPLSLLSNNLEKRFSAALAR